MKLLFIDIECCNGYNICSFGYVLTNDLFEIIKKEDIVINPNRRFKLSRANFDPSIELAYDQEFFYKQPKFNQYYEKIKEILTDKENICFGHSVLSDMRFLNNDCKRYKLPVLKIKSFDTQKIYNKNKQVKLETIAKELNIDVSNLMKHKSCDDAEISMLILKKICEDKKITIKTLIEENKDCLVKNNFNKQTLNKKRKTKNEKYKKNTMYIAFQKAYKERRIKYNQLKKLNNKG